LFNKEVENRVKKQLIMGCVFLGFFIILGSLQVVFSPFTFVRGISLLAVIGCSAGVGAFIRELFILKEKKQVSK
jgi:uncharacterized membrane-anchored protein